MAPEAAAAGLDRDQAVEVLADDLYVGEVWAAEALWRAGDQCGPGGGGGGEVSDLGRTAGGGV